MSASVRPASFQSLVLMTSPSVEKSLGAQYELVVDGERVDQGRQEVAGVGQVVAVRVEGAVADVARELVGRDVEDVRRVVAGEALAELLGEVGGDGHLGLDAALLRPRRHGVLDRLGLGVAGRADQDGELPGRLRGVVVALRSRSRRRRGRGWRCGEGEGGQHAAVPETVLHVLLLAGGAGGDGTVRCGWSRGRRARAGAGSADGWGSPASICSRAATRSAATCSSGWRRLVSPGVVRAAAGELSKPVTATSGPARRPRSSRARSTPRARVSDEQTIAVAGSAGVEEPVGRGAAGVEVVGLLGVQVAVEPEGGRARRASPGGGRDRSRSPRGQPTYAIRRCPCAGDVLGGGADAGAAVDVDPGQLVVAVPRAAEGRERDAQLAQAATRPSSVWVLASTNASTAVVASRSR